MTDRPLSPLISTENLAAILDQPSLKIVDGTWNLDGSDAFAPYRDAHIPGAVFFDLEAASDPSSGLPHTLPSPEDFAAYAGSLGLSETDHIVVYDQAGLFSAARIWWMLTIMGARRVQVLDGGLPAWRNEGRPLETGAVSPALATFTAHLQTNGVADFDAVTEALAGHVQVADARGAARFRGEAAEPRPGVRAGHMPGALNLPYASLLQSDGRMKQGDALRQAFSNAGLDPDQPLIASCGSGVTAAIPLLGLTMLGREPGAEARLYDGSWAEWGARKDAPVVTG